MKKLWQKLTDCREKINQLEFSKDGNSATPETDALFDELVQEHFLPPELLTLARKLERERDELKNALAQQHHD